MSVAIHPLALVSPKAELGDNVEIGPFCWVGEKVCIGSGTKLEAFVSVKDHVVLGKNCRVHEHAVLGGEPQDHAYGGEVSWVRIGDDNVIRENVTVNRATGEGRETSVGSGCFLMAGVHLAHNVRLGNHVTVANGVGLAGHASVGDHTVLGGLCGVHQFARIGNYCMVGGLFRVTKDVPPYTLVSGEPLRIAGLNLVGLKRAGVGPETRRAILNFYRDLYGSGKTFTQALKEAQSKAENLIPEIRAILKFYEGSKRGVTFWNQGSNSED